VINEGSIWIIGGYLLGLTRERGERTAGAVYIHKPESTDSRAQAVGVVLQGAFINKAKYNHRILLVDGWTW
jgi:hypothetical protein